MSCSQAAGQFELDLLVTCFVGQKSIGGFLETLFEWEPEFD